LICAFVAEHRARFGVAPICRVLTEHSCAIAPRTFYAWLAGPPSARALWDTVITEVLAGYYEPDERGRRKPESLYGATKMWAHLQRQGITVARCTVERLMRVNGWRGVTRRKKVRTTIVGPAAARAADLVKRQFRVPAPNMLLVADFTYVRLTSGVFVYTAFAVAATLVGSWAGPARQARVMRSCDGRSATPRNSASARESHCWATLFTTAMRARRANSTGRRNTSTNRRWLVGYGKRQLEVRSYRGQIRSPGRPTVAWREDRVKFWAAIAAGVLMEVAAAEAGVSSPVGVRWFCHAGGVNPRLPESVSANTCRRVSGRILRCGVRKVLACARSDVG
jgi:hypothetical protein